MAFGFPSMSSRQARSFDRPGGGAWVPCVVVGLLLLGHGPLGMIAPAKAEAEPVALADAVVEVRSTEDSGGEVVLVTSVVETRASRSQDGSGGDPALARTVVETRAGADTDAGSVALARTVVEARSVLGAGEQRATPVLGHTVVESRAYGDEPAKTPSLSVSVVEIRSHLGALVQPALSQVVVELVGVQRDVSQIAFDATRLSPVTLAISQDPPVELASDTVATLDLPAGDHVFQELGSERSFVFSVAADGIVDYGAELDSWVAGRGTSTIVLAGLAMAFDTRGLGALSSAVFSPSSVFDLPSETTTTLRLLPGSYQLEAGSEALSFDVSGEGLLDGLPESFLGLRVRGQGTDLLSFVPPSCDATEASFLEVLGGRAGDNLGWSIDLAGDLAVVGAPAVTSDATGSVRVHRWVDDAWDSGTEIVDPMAEPGDRFGASVALDGDVLVVGSPGDDGACPEDPSCNSGVVSVFRHMGGAWAFEARLVASEAAAGMRLGDAVAASGGRIVVGSSRDSSELPKAGAAHVFRYDPTQGEWVEEAKLVAPEVDSMDRFGTSVAIEGDIVVVGAPRDDGVGSSHVFRFDGVEWQPEAELVPLSSSPDGFGGVVGLSGDEIAIGASRDDGACPSDPDCDSGAVYLFRFDGADWIESARLAASDASRGDRFGHALSMGSGLVVVGVPGAGATESDPGPGRVDVFRWDGRDWNETLRLNHTMGETGGQFGASVAVGEGRLLVGSPWQDFVDVDSGIVSFFDDLTGGDRDGDRICDGSDNCPDQPNPDQPDSDFDGVGEACDLCLGDDATGDADGDGLCNDRDDAPDLVPNTLSLACDPENPDPGEETIFSVEVINVGTAASPESRVDFYADEQLLGSATLPPLDLGQSASVAVTVSSNAVGPWVLTAIADPEDQIFELVETNNSATRLKGEVGTEASLVVHPTPVEGNPFYGEPESPGEPPINPEVPRFALGDELVFNGRAFYRVTHDGTAGDSVGVAGGSVILRVLDGFDQTVATQDGGTTDDRGEFRRPWTAPSAPGRYRLEIEVRDGAASGFLSLTFDVDDPLGYWTLDDGMGGQAWDSSAYANPGSLAGEPTWSSGQASGGLHFDGLDDLVEISDPEALFESLEALTVALWVLPEAPGGTQELVSKDNAFELEIGKISPMAYSLRLDNSVQGAGETPIEPGVWQHLAVTWDGSTVRYYFNGLADGRASFEGSLGSSPSPLGLGGRPGTSVTGGPTFFFEGRLDDVRLYGRALSSQEIASIVDTTLVDVVPPTQRLESPRSALPAGTTEALVSLTTDESATCRYSTVEGLPFGDRSGELDPTASDAHTTLLSGLVDGSIETLFVRCQDVLGNTSEDLRVLVAVGATDLVTRRISYWTFDEGVGCLASDVEGRNDAALGPSCPATAPRWAADALGGPGSSLLFEGGGQEARVEGPVLLSPLQQLTVAAWIRHPDSTGAYRAILDHRDGGLDGYDLYLDPASRLFLRVNELTLTGHQAVADDTWHHVVGTYDGLELRIYVDGILDSRVPTTATTIDTTAALYLGRHLKSALDYPFLGGMDEIQIHDRALTAVEVVELYLLSSPLD